EEYPPILSNIGMGSLLLNYYRKTDPYDTYVPELSVGDPVILDMMDESPFMNFGDVERGQVIPSLFNNLIRAPLFSHDAKDTDFLVI
ncbi:7055_t:CDS:2, partial [Dentiscutata heterogama]